ncbi:MAG: dockerin type I repeat-containing protein [Clostridia bacterium]|nr:dockerin type I repeat-containing protein [Clostridia bacterium]
MKKAFSKILSVLLVIALMFTLVAMPTSAVVAKGEYTVKEWKFDSEYSASYLAKDNVEFLDEGEIAIANKNWHDSSAAPTARTIKDGVLKIELKTSSDSKYFSTTNFALRLDETLKAKQEYTFKLGIYSPDKIWSSKTYIMYSDAASLTNTGFANYIANKSSTPSVDTKANFGIPDVATELNITQIGSLTDSNKVYDFAFTPETDIESGNYIRVALNFRNTDANTVKTVYVTSLGLSTYGELSNDSFEKDSANDYILKTWNFDKNFSDSALTKDTVSTVDTNGEVLMGYQNYHDNNSGPVVRTISDGVLNLAMSKSTRGNAATVAYYSTTNIAFKLGKELVAGQRYTFELGMYSPDKAWSYNTFISYSDGNYITTNNKFANEIACSTGTPSVDNAANFGIKDGGATKLVIRQIKNLTDENKVYGFTFIPETDIAADNYIRVSLNFRNTSDTVSNVYVTSAALKATNSELENKDSDGKFRVQKWNFNLDYSDADITKDSVNTIDSDAEIYMSYKAWHDDTAAPVVRTVENGVLKLALTEGNSKYFSTTNLAFKLDKDLTKGVEYTLELGMYGDVAANGNTIWSNKTWIMASTTDTLNTVGFTPYVANKSGPSVDNPDNFGITDGYATRLMEKQIGRLPSENTIHSFTFVPEEDIPADDVLRVALNFTTATGNVYVTSVELKASADEWMDEYFFSDEYSQERVWENAETDPQADENDEVYGAYKRSGHNLIMVLNNFPVEANAEYTAILKAATTFGGSYVSAYAFKEKPEDYVGKDEYDTYYNNIDNAVLIDEKIAWVPNVSNNNDRRTVKATFSTAGCDIDFDEYIYLAIYINNVKNSDDTINWNNIIYADELTMYKTVSGNADFERLPVMQNNYFNKIKFADDRFATYYLKANDGTLTEIDGNEIANLNADTNYTFVAKWAENGRYHASKDYSNEVSFKTLKYGDMNRDGRVDIVDLVVQKKGILATDYDETYDLDSDTAINGSDIVLLVKHLLNIED